MNDQTKLKDVIQDSTQQKSSAVHNDKRDVLSDAQKVPQKENAEPSIQSVLDTFLLDVKSIQKTHSLVLPHVLKWLKSTHSENTKKLQSFKDIETDDAALNKFVAKGAHQASEMIRAIRTLDGLGGFRIPDTLQKSLFTQLFSEFDAFIGALLKVIYVRKSELLKGISREITFADLLSYEDLNAVKLDLLNKEIEAFRRDSYVDQFVALEKKFSLKLRSFPEWCEFVELSQRRNLIVHNGGVVSEQYLVVCDREGYPFETRPNIGQQLEADPKYFSRAIVVVSAVAFMLAHTLWRKVFPGETKEAHDHTNHVIYELLKDQRWRASAEIAKFSLTEPMKRGIDEMGLRIRTVNAAIAFKFSGKQAACDELLNLMDWSASYRDFRLAIDVLQDRFDSAADYMRKIGKNGEMVDELGYHEWPLFHKFRESMEFQNAYQEIYGISFVTEAVRQSAEAAKLGRDVPDSATVVEDVIAIPPKPKAKVASRRQKRTTISAELPDTTVKVAKKRDSVLPDLKRSRQRS